MTGAGRSFGRRLLTQAVFAGAACAVCLALLLSQMNAQFRRRGETELAARAQRFAVLAAAVVDASALQDGSPEARAYLQGVCAAVFPYAQEPGGDMSWALYRLADGGVITVATGAEVFGPAGREEYELTCLSDGPVVMQVGARVHALQAVRDEAGEAVGIVETVGSMQPFDSQARYLQGRVLLAAGVGLACMGGVYMIALAISAWRRGRRERRGAA